VTSKKGKRKKNTQNERGKREGKVFLKGFHFQGKKGGSLPNGEGEGPFRKKKLTGGFTPRKRMESFPQRCELKGGGVRLHPQKLGGGVKKKKNFFF